jgi:hypothetical protein
MLHQHIFNVQPVPALFLPVILKRQVLDIKKLSLALVGVYRSHLLASVCTLSPQDRFFVIFLIYLVDICSSRQLSEGPFPLTLDHLLGLIWSLLICLRYLWSVKIKEILLIWLILRGLDLRVRFVCC